MIRTIGCFVLICCSILSCDSKINTSEKGSKLVNDTIFLKTLNKAVPYKIYLPETYDASENLNVLYLLHGHGGSDDDWFSKEEGDAKTILDSLIKAKSINPLVAVTLDAENTWYVDSNEKMESAYINEFIPIIEETYKISKERNSRVIAGNSAGGFGTLRFSLKYPHLFHSSILLSPASYYPKPPDISSSRKIDVFKKDGVFNDSIWESFSYRNLIKLHVDYPKFYTSTGDDDAYQIFDVVYDLSKFFSENAIKNETTVINGGHDWVVWRYCFANDLTRIYKE